MRDACEDRRTLVGMDCGVCKFSGAGHIPGHMFSCVGFDSSMVAALSKEQRNYRMDCFSQPCHNFLFG